MSLEIKLARWSDLSGCLNSEAEVDFIQAMRKAAAAGVGYGWMQQVIEWEWQATGIGAWGPEYFERRISKFRGIE